MKIYKTKELSQFNELIQNAKTLWVELSHLEYTKNGDRGCCVLGAGIEIYVLPPRCKHPRTLTIITFNEVSPCQGEHAASSVSNAVIEFLKENGLEARYNHGRMD